MSMIASSIVYLCKNPVGNQKFYPFLMIPLPNKEPWLEHALYHMIFAKSLLPIFQIIIFGFMELFIFLMRDLCMKVMKVKWKSTK